MSASLAPAQEARPGEPIEYQPFFPDRWKERKQPTRMTPWEGERVVLLTTRADLDGKTMAVFLNRLDAGWKLYEDLIGKKPAPFRHHNGKVTIAAVPEAGFTCGMGCGYLGLTGIEIAGFYKDFFGGPGDYDLVRKDPEVFAHYYFYEMGRNYYLFGDRLGMCSTGFAVAMRYVCMDGVGCKDPDLNTRGVVERWERAFAESKTPFGEAFREFGATQPFVLNDRDGKPYQFNDLNSLFACGFLKLRKDHGGDDWVRRFSRHLFDCPPSPTKDPDGATGQLLNWVVAASLAAGKDLSPVFRDRWRFPFPPGLWRALGTVDWGKKGLTASAVFDSLPPEHVPLAAAIRRPAFLTAERRRANLIVGGTFEGGLAGEWRITSGTGDKVASVTREVAKEGTHSIVVRSAVGRDVSAIQRVKVAPNTRYLLSGWVRTRDVTKEGNGITGANLSLLGGWEASEHVVGDSDWTYVVLLFDSGKRTEVEVCARLGFYAAEVKGTAWFDDITLVAIGKTPESK